MPAEVGRALAQSWDLARSGWAAVTAPRTLRWRWVVLVAWVAGIVGDAYTTAAMMATGQFEEANPVAAAGMGALGTGGYVATASLWCVALAVASCGRPRTFYARVVLGALWVAGAWKLWTAAANALLWAGAAG